MHQLLDLTFWDWVRTLEWLRTHWPAMFEAVWRRDAREVRRLLGKRALPPMNFLRKCANQLARFKALVGIFWEAERLFELLHAFGGRERVTIGRLRATLGSTSILGRAIGDDSRTANYAVGAWCHRYSLARLFAQGADANHLDAHPHIALGPDGTAQAIDEHAGSNSLAALDIIDGNICTAPPIVIDQRLRRVADEHPAHFFAGRDVRTLAVLFLLDVRQFLVSNQGGRGPSLNRWFDLTIDGAIGRFAAVMTSRICADTADAVVGEAERYLKNGRIRVLFSDLVANPIAWQRLYIRPGKKVSEIASGSEDLGSNFLGSMVRGVVAEECSFLQNDPSRIGHSLCFRPDAWFEPYQEANDLIHAWRSAGAKHKAAFPGCFDSSISAMGLTFSAQVAATLLPSAIPMWEDAHSRKSDRLRARRPAGRPTKKPR